MSSAVEKMLESLGQYERRNGYCTAECPTHQDRKHSLSLTEGDHGRVLLKCCVGCENSDRDAELGLEMRDLFPPSANGHRNSHKKAIGKPAPTWCIRDTQGELQIVHVRFDRNGGKDYLW